MLIHYGIFIHALSLLLTVSFYFQNCYVLGALRTSADTLILFHNHDSLWEYQPQAGKIQNGVRVTSPDRSMAVYYPDLNNRQPNAVYQITSYTVFILGEGRCYVMFMISLQAAAI